MKTISRKIQFQVEGVTLMGELHLPDISNPPVVVGSHGLEGSMSSAKQAVLSWLLPKNGLGFLRFDHRGCGRSQGDFLMDTSLEKRTQDYLGAVQAVLDLHLTSPKIGVFGSSMGGATCINAWDGLEALGAIVCGGVLCSAPVRSRTIENIPVQANDHRPALPLEFFKNNLLFNLLGKTQALHHVLIFHGDADEVVPVSNAHAIYGAMQNPKKLIIHPGGDHQTTLRIHQAEFERETVNWFLEIFELCG